MWFSPPEQRHPIRGGKPLCVAVNANSEALRYISQTGFHAVSPSGDSRQVSGGGNMSVIEEDNAEPCSNDQATPKVPGKPENL